jgi:serine/threonine protein kinase
MHFPVGTVIREYQVLERLRQGGMGSVYKVLNLKTKRFEASKVLHEHAATDSESRDRFVREGEVLASLDHPNIARVRTFFEEKGVQFLVAEFVEGADLDEIVRKSLIELPRTVD